MAITRNMPKRKRSEHYVNNKEFLTALIRYREDVEITYIKKFGEPPDKAGRASSWDISSQLLSKIVRSIEAIHFLEHERVDLLEWRFQFFSKIVQNQRDLSPVSVLMTVIRNLSVGI